MENNVSSVNAQMVIRRSVDDVFQAFINPDLTKNFWFTKGSNHLEVGNEVIWTWEMYDFSAKVIATDIRQGQLISFDWYGSEHPTQVRIDFTELGDNATLVAITHSGFNEVGDELIRALKDSTEGFNIVLAGLKAYMEHGINLNLIADKYPNQ